MGIQQGWATPRVDPSGRAAAVSSPARYDVTAIITREYADGCRHRPRRTRRRTYALVVQTETAGRAAPRPARPRPRRRPPPSRTASAAGTPGRPGARPARRCRRSASDAHGKGNRLRFAATVWNAGDSPLVVDGFRRAGEDVMDAYQYFFDADGNQTGYQQVGEMHWHAGPTTTTGTSRTSRATPCSTRTWTEAVTSTKQSFCLANTDAVDYTVPERRLATPRTPTSPPPAAGTTRCRSARCSPRARATPTSSTAPARPSSSATCPTAPTTSRSPPTRWATSSSPTPPTTSRCARSGWAARTGQRWVEAAPVGIVEETWPGMVRPTLR